MAPRRGENLARNTQQGAAGHDGREEQEKIADYGNNNGGYEAIGVAHNQQAATYHASHGHEKQYRVNQKFRGGALCSMKP